MEKRATSIVQKVTNAAYILVSIILFIIAFTIIFWSVYQIITDVIHGSSSETGWRLYKVMEEVAFIVFAVAVADVARYLLVEEVLHGKEKKPHAERRKALSNLILIITTAFSLEGLILTIQMAKISIEKLIYPIMLLIVSAILLIALGLYQKLSNASSKDEL